MNKISKVITCISLSLFIMVTLANGTNFKGSANTETAKAGTAINNPNPPCIISSVVITGQRNVICDGGASGAASAAASGGTAPYTYSWSNGETTAAATGLAAGTYTINVVDNAGCTGSDTVVIRQPPPLHDSIVITERITCPGTTGAATVIVRGGTSPYTYSWTNTQTTATITGLTAGTYGVRVTDSCGTSVTAGIIMHPPPPLRDTIVAFNVLCYGGDHAVAASRALGGSPPFTFSWSNGETVPNDTLLMAGTYTVTVSDSCGASATESIVITQPTAITITHDSTDQTSVSCNGIAGVTPSGGTAPYTYSWATGGTSDTINNQCAGTYCCLITDNNGCAQSVCVTVNLATGLNTINKASVVSIYPDPNNGYFSVSGVSPGQTVELYNYLGQNLIRQLVNDNATIHFDISADASGVYLIRILNKDRSVVIQQKIVKTQ